MDVRYLWNGAAIVLCGRKLQRREYILTMDALYQLSYRGTISIIAYLKINKRQNPLYQHEVTTLGVALEKWSRSRTRLFALAKNLPFLLASKIQNLFWIFIRFVVRSNLRFLSSPHHLKIRK